MNNNTYRKVKITTHDFHNNNQLLAFLTEMATVRMSGKLVIIAGHYMLIYRRTAGEFVPLMSSIAHQADATVEEKVQVRKVGDFPETSFEMGMHLIRSRGGKDVKVALLVNDHQFLIFQRGLPTESEINQIRRKFFRVNTSIPAPFATIASRYSVQGDFIEHNDDARRQPTSSLPPKTIYFSETSLRNRLRKANKRHWLLEHIGFKRKVNFSGKSRIVYRFPDGVREVCLIDERGGCGCSGEIIEFLLLLQDKGARNLILFIPLECQEPVRAAIEAALCSLVKFDTIAVAWGGGEMMEESFSENLVSTRFTSVTVFSCEGGVIC